MDLEGKSFTLDVVTTEVSTGPGLDVDYFAQQFAGSLWDGLGLRRVPGQGKADFRIRANVVSMDPGSRWGRYLFGPFAGAAVFEARVEVGDGQVVWGEVDAEGKRRWTLFEPDDDSVTMLADAASLAGQHAASKIIPILKSH